VAVKYKRGVKYASSYYGVMVFWQAQQLFSAYLMHTLGAVYSSKFSKF